MPAIQPLTLVDNSPAGSAVFDPFSTSNDSAVWRNTSGGVPIGYSTVSITKKEPQNANGVFRVRLTVNVPTLESVLGATASGFAPAPTLAYSEKANIEFLLPARCSLIERQKLLTLVQSALADAQITNAISDLAVPY